jgi:hypothetical protein
MPPTAPTPTYSIAIVGAGFAGLTLANYLSDSKCEVLEAKDEPIPIVGTIRLHSAVRVLQEWGLFRPGLTTPNDSSVVHRQSFLQTLRVHAKIVYGFRIKRIDQQDHGKRFLIDTRDRRRGPFDCIVMANGLSFDAVSTQLILDCDAVLGDARWQYDTWFWDFGRTRVERGGDIALEDARELAHAILSSGQQQITSSELRGRIPCKFRPKSHLRRWHTSKLIFMAVVATVVARFLSTLNKI